MSEKRKRRHDGSARGPGAAQERAPKLAVEEVQTPPRSPADPLLGAVRRAERTFAPVEGCSLYLPYSVEEPP